MADYKRFISYMYEYDSGKKLSNIGYAKIEAKNEQCKFSLHIAVPQWNNKILKAYLFTRTSSRYRFAYLGELTMKGGIGDLKVKSERGNVKGSEWSFDDGCGIVVYENEWKFVACEWDDVEIPSSLVKYINNPPDYNYAAGETPVVKIVDKKEIQTVDGANQTLQQQPQQTTQREVEQPRQAYDQRAPEQPGPVYGQRVVEQPRQVYGQRAPEQPGPVYGQRVVEQPRQVYGQRVVEQPRQAYDQRVSEQPRQAYDQRGVEQPGQIYGSQPGNYSNQQWGSQPGVAQRNPEMQQSADLSRIMQPQTAADMEQNVAGGQSQKRRESSREENAWLNHLTKNIQKLFGSTTYTENQTMDQARAAQIENQNPQQPAMNQWNPQQMNPRGPVRPDLVPAPPAGGMPNGQMPRNGGPVRPPLQPAPYPYGQGPEMRQGTTPGIQPGNEPNYGPRRPGIQPPFGVRTPIVQPGGQRYQEETGLRMDVQPQLRVHQVSDTGTQEDTTPRYPVQTLGDLLNESQKSQDAGSTTRRRITEIRSDEESSGQMHSEELYGQCQYYGGGMKQQEEEREWYRNLSYQEEFKPIEEIKLEKEFDSTIRNSDPSKVEADLNQVKDSYYDEVMEQLRNRNLTDKNGRSAQSNQSSQENQEFQEVDHSQNGQEIQENQDSQNNQEIQEFQEDQDNQNSQEIQEDEDSQNNQEIQEDEDSQYDEDEQYDEDVQYDPEKQYNQESQDSQSVPGQEGYEEEDMGESRVAYPARTIGRRITQDIENSESCGCMENEPLQTQNQNPTDRQIDNMNETIDHLTENQGETDGYVRAKDSCYNYNNKMKQNLNLVVHPIAEMIFRQFPKIYPFVDNEITDCVRIEPQDIGLLPIEAWVLGNNSFLLHGYYSYKHLIFGKINQPTGYIYILGVPGVYYNRERFMAKMFGFGQFKCAKKTEQRNGEFGYWYVPIILN